MSCVEGELMTKDGIQSLADRIDACLPQTQCQECDFSACRPYAEAVAAGDAPIDRCQPGGEPVLRELAQLVALDPEPMVQGVLSRFRPASVVKIDLNTCIGCVKCIKVCPVDAIVGAAKHAHVVLPDVCTGCNLCIEPCPVDCIEVVPLPHGSVMDRSMEAQSRSRFEKRQRRLAALDLRKQRAYQRVQKKSIEDFL